MTADPPASDSGVSEWLRRFSKGDAQAAEALLPQVYEELHRIASREMGRQAPGHTLQTTALVNEAFVKLFGQSERTWKDRRHFLALAAVAMRSILVDHARAKNAKKRTPGGRRQPLDEMLIQYEDRCGDVVEFDLALQKLNELDPELVTLVELRFFAGLTIGECARVLGKSTRTVERHLQAAKAWLRRELS